MSSITLKTSIEDKYSATIDYSQSLLEWDTAVFPLLTNEEKTLILTYFYYDYRHVIDLITGEALEKELLT